MGELYPVLSRTVLALDQAGAPYAIVGSVAGMAWGIARTTQDVDLVALIDTTRGDRIIELLASDDSLYVPIDDARRALRTAGSFNVLHPRSGGKVDVFVALPDDFDRSRIERRIALQLLGVDTWVATAEDVVLAKLRWRLDSRSEVQWRDCLEIASTQRLDRDYLAGWATLLGVDDDLRELLTAADHAG
ncbi:MAG TPA: hypothetical protein VNQ73_23420 [Ilumatobacter sp.]|nr:hypothetical protein [Ilumatobacter sp.]